MTNTNNTNTNNTNTNNTNTPTTYADYVRRLAVSYVAKINRLGNHALSESDVDDVCQIMLTSYAEYWRFDEDAMTEAYSKALRNVENGKADLYHAVGQYCYNGVKEYVSSFRQDTGVYTHCYRLDDNNNSLQIVDESKRLERIVSNQILPNNENESEFIGALVNALSDEQLFIWYGLASGQTRETVCRVCGISNGTYYKRLKEIKETAEKLDSGNVLKRYRKIEKRHRNNRNVALKCYIQTVDANITKAEKLEIEDYFKALRHIHDGNNVNRRKK